MKVLLSIKPEYAEKIFEGSKKYEFRKILFKNPEITRVIVYASYPVQKVIGEFEIENVISESPTKLWRQTKEDSGITKSFFDSYFLGKSQGHAIKIKFVERYNKPLCLKQDFQIQHPPQSFMYVK